MKNLKRFDKLFIAGMTNSGTTITHRLVNRCENTAWMAREGRMILQKYMTRTGETIAPKECKWPDFRVYSERMDELRNADYYNWNKIKEIWYKKWAVDTEDHPCLLVECSPSNPARIDMLRSEFENANVLILVRNPFAVIEGITRRENVPLDRAVEHVGRVMKILLQQTTPRIHWISYEQIVSDPSILGELLEATFDYVSSFEQPGEFDVHNIHDESGPLKNYNKEQIARMEPDQLEYCYKELNKLCRSALGFFGYYDHPLESYSSLS